MTEPQPPSPNERPASARRPSRAAELLTRRAEARLTSRLRGIRAAAARATPRPALGRVARAGGLSARANLPGAEIGRFVRLRRPGAPRGSGALAQIVAIDDGDALLSVAGDLDGLTADTLAAPAPEADLAPAGDLLLGRVLDGFGHPLDAPRNGPLPAGLSRVAIHAAPPAPLSRPRIDCPLETGAAAIDGFLTLGRGQRVGLFGEAGLGKSRLLANIVRRSDADVAVVALVGERGREVSEFLEDALGPQGLERAVVVAATSDRSAVERVRAPFLAAAIAEHFRDQGRDVLFVMDSLTRLARAQREIGLSVGEAPARRAFPPSVFALLAKLIERAGRAEEGSITGIYTLLVEGEDGADDPIAEEARALLDGHIQLSRRLAAAGRFPAVDILASRSRLMDRVAAESHVAAAARLRALMAKRREIDLLVSVGEHKAGVDAEADEALAKSERIEALIRPSGGRKPRALDALADAMAALAWRGSEDDA